MAWPSLVNSAEQHLVTNCLHPAIVRLVRIVTWRKRAAANPRWWQGKTCSRFFSVHEPVDDLCKTALALCAGGGNAGDSGAGSRS